MSRRGSVLIALVIGVILLESLRDRAIELAEKISARPGWSDRVVVGLINDHCIRQHRKQMAGHTRALGFPWGVRANGRCRTHPFDRIHWVTMDGLFQFFDRKKVTRAYVHACKTMSRG